MRPPRRRSALCLAWSLVLAAPFRAQELPEPFSARVRTTLGCDTLVLQDGTRVRLQGVSLPTPSVRPPEFAAESRDWLAERVVGTDVFVEPEPRSGSSMLAIVRSVPGGPAVQADMISAGRAIFSYRTASTGSIDELRAAARRAQVEDRGWFARTDRREDVVSVPYLNGAVLGLQKRDPNADYLREVDELAQVGFRHLSLIFATFLRTVEAHEIDRHHERTVPDRRLLETIRHARNAHGMRVLLLPIVLILDAGEDDWRGTLRPVDEQAFWLEYDAMLAHYLDIAEASGAEMFSIGSELGSLEDRTETWRRLVENARGRYTGLLTYSANWDHVHVPRFFDALDAVGMTAYFSISETDDPDLDALRAGWQRVADTLRETVAGIERPVFFTEMGYASQNGISTDPWNYFIAPDAIDVREQALCFEAALHVLPTLDFLAGAYWFEYALDGGRGDAGYSPRGKPALDVWRRWASLRVRREVVGLPR